MTFASVLNLTLKLSLSTLLLSSVAQANGTIPSYKANITRDGVTKVRVIQSFWSGEYPGPVVDINAKAAKGTTTIPVYKSIRDLSGKTTCAVKNGVYHEWSRTKNSVLNYYAISALEEYIAEKDLTISTADEPTYKAQLKAGTKLTEIVYFGEGYSGGVIDDGKTRKQVILDNESYGALEKTPGLKQLSANEPLKGDMHYEQWIRVKCEDGRKLFASVDELLKTKGVQEGTILEYGRAGRADETYE